MIQISVEKFDQNSKLFDFFSISPVFIRNFEAKTMIKNWIYKLRLSKAIRKANRLYNETRYKYYVLPVKGKPRVYARKTLKLLIKTKFFKKGTTIQALEKRALYTT